MQPEPPPPYIQYPRVLFYAVNGLGLGHVTRQLAIARAVRRQRPGAQILFVTTSEADSIIYREGFASIKMPSRSIIIESRIWPGTYTKLAQSVVMNTIAAFNPAILVTDTFPTGATGELLSTLSWDMRRVFIFRAQKPEKCMEIGFREALQRYDLVISPHTRGSEVVTVPDGLRVEWVGPVLIREQADGLGRDNARRKLKLPLDQQLLYVTVGGGGDDEMVQSEPMVFKAAKEAGWVTVAPEAPLSKSNRSFAAEFEPDFRVSYYPMAECLNAFDAAISAAGYNSVHEMLYFGVSTVFIPRERSLDDQFARARWVTENRAGIESNLSFESIKSALELLRDKTIAVEVRRNARSLVNTNGADSAASAILGLL